MATWDETGATPRLPASSADAGTARRSQKEKEPAEDGSISNCCRKHLCKSNTAASFSRIAVLVYCDRFQALLSRYCSKRTIQCFKQTIASLCSVPPNCRRGTPNNNVATKMREQTNGSGCADELRNHIIVLSRRADTRVRRQKEHRICALFLPLGGWLRPLRLK